MHYLTNGEPCCRHDESHATCRSVASYQKGVARERWLYRNNPMRREAKLRKVRDQYHNQTAAQKIDRNVKDRRRRALARLERLTAMGDEVWNDFDDEDDEDDGFHGDFSED